MTEPLWWWRMLNIRHLFSWWNGPRETHSGGAWSAETGMKYTGQGLIERTRHSHRQRRNLIPNPVPGNGKVLWKFQCSSFWTTYLSAGLLIRDSVYSGSRLYPDGFNQANLKTSCGMGRKQNRRKTMGEPYSTNSRWDIHDEAHADRDPGFSAQKPTHVQHRLCHLFHSWAEFLFCFLFHADMRWPRKNWEAKEHHAWLFYWMVGPF